MSAASNYKSGKTKTFLRYQSTISPFSKIKEKVMEVRTCLECGAPLKGRADQKYCNDLCRNAYHNKKLGRSSNYMRKINRILKKNHSVLKALNPDGKTTTFRSTLEKQGFLFDYFTHIYTTRSGRVYYFVYDEGYSELDNKRFMLVRKEDI